MSKIYKSVLDTIGNTPVIQLNSCVPRSEHSFFAKIEFFNPGGSVKDRIALSIVEDAEKAGLLKPGGTIIEATSGNTGVGLAMVAAIKGYKCIFVMPDKISEEKRATLRAYGARVVITPTAVEPEDPRSFYSVARKFVEITPNSYYANQYNNPSNVQKHYQMTGPEIWDQMGGDIDVFVGGMGTGGTLSGVGRFLKEKNPNVKIVCADPFGSILFDLFYHKEIRSKPHSYLVEGIGEDMLPENVHFDVMDDFIKVADPEIFQLTRRISKEEGLLVGPSCGAALLAAIKYSKMDRLKKPSRILSLFPDGGRSYLSKAYNESWMREKSLLEPILGQSRVMDLLKNIASVQEIPHATVETSLKAAVQMMKSQGLTTLPVLSGGNLIGVVDAEDILLTLASGKLRADEPLLHLVKGATHEVTPETSLIELEQILLQTPFVRVKGPGTMISRFDLAHHISGLNA